MGKNIYSPADDACRQLRRMLGAKLFYTYLPLREKRLFFHQKLRAEELLHRMELEKISCKSPPFGWHRYGKILRRISTGNNKVTNFDLSSGVARLSGALVRFNSNLGGRLFSSLPLPPPSPSPPLSLLFPSPAPPLPRSGPQIQLWVWGSAVSSLSGVWSRAPAEIEFGAF